MRIFIRGADGSRFLSGPRAYAPDRMMTDLPNVLTLSRIAAIPLLVARGAALAASATSRPVCFAAAAITD